MVSLYLKEIRGTAKTGEMPKVTHRYNGRTCRALLEQDIVWLGHALT